MEKQIKYILDNTEITSADYLEKTRKNEIELVNISANDSNRIYSCKTISEARRNEYNLKESYKLTLAKSLKYLEDTDFKVLKYIEGKITIEDFTIISNLREEARNKVNEMKEKLGLIGE